MFVKRFRTSFGLSLKNAISGKLKALLARGYMSHTLILEDLPATKWSRYPWSTQLGSLGVWLYPGHVCPYMGTGFTQGHTLIKHL